MDPLALKKASLAARCDSFVVETNVHCPTDINLLLDALRKTITLTADYAPLTGIGGCRQSAYNCRQIKKAPRKTQQMKRSSSRGVIKKEKRQAENVQAHRDYLDLARQFIHKSQTTLATELVDTENQIELAKRVDHGIHGFKRDVALAIVAMNIQKPDIINTIDIILAVLPPAVQGKI